MKIFNGEKFGSDLKDFRKKKKLTQNKLAENLNTNRSTISNLEREKHLPSFELLEKFCEYNDMDPRNYFTTKQKEPALFMQGRLKDEDIVQMQETIKDIMIHEKYYALHKRCFQ